MISLMKRVLVARKNRNTEPGLKVWFAAKNGDCALQHVGEKILWLLAVRYKMWERKRSFPGLICIYGRNSRPFRMRILLRWVFASGGHCATKRVHCRKEGWNFFSYVCIKNLYIRFIWSSLSLLNANLCA
jgi:hypothetical protein